MRSVPGIVKPILSWSGSCTLAFGIVVAGTVAQGCTATASRPVSRLDAQRDMERGDYAAARRKFVDLARERIDTMEGALAVDMVNELDGYRAYPEQSYGCDAAAEAIGDRAEAFFRQNALVEAREAFAEALRACPANARWWIHAGDVEFQARSMPAARELYRKGLEIDPWNRGGHRYLADAEAALGNATASLEQLLLAVLSDPAYEAGWEYLRMGTLEAGGSFRRHYEAKPRLEVDGIDSTLVMPEHRESACANAWAYYGALLVTAESRRLVLEAARELAKDGKGEVTAALRRGDREVEIHEVERDRQWAAASPFEREKMLVLLTLENFPEGLQDDCHRESKKWPLLREAAAKGYLDEAIFLHLFDPALAPEYARFRAKHAARLLEYLSGYVAVLPTGTPRHATTASLETFPTMAKARRSPGVQARF